MAQDPTPVAGDDGELAAAPTSPLTSLRERRRKAVKALHLDIAIPRYDPPLYVRFRPVEQKRIDFHAKRFEKSKDEDRTVLANCATLAEAVIGVFEVDDEDRKVSPLDPDVTDPADWPGFDETLAAALLDEDEVAPTSATEVIRRAVYFTDGDIIAHATRLAEWSGYTLAEAEELSAGN